MEIGESIAVAKKRVVKGIVFFNLLALVVFLSTWAAIEGWELTVSSNLMIFGGVLAASVTGSVLEWRYHLKLINRIVVRQTEGQVEP